jgi:hypothetical protein
MSVHVLQRHHSVLDMTTEYAYTMQHNTHVRMYLSTCTSFTACQ